MSHVQDGSPRQVAPSSAFRHVGQPVFIPGRGLAEEAPFAYKDVERVVDVVVAAGLARRVARLRPLGVVTG